MTERKGLVRLEDCFSPKLSQREIDRRRNYASLITNIVVHHPDWSQDIREAYLYGSMVYGKPRTNSDTDIAIITRSTSVLNDDPKGSYLSINGVFQYYREKLKIPYFKVDCAICPEELFDHPENEPEDGNRQLYLDRF